ncbi:putative pyridoxamine 5'-phosphate oxidase [Lyophyllum shimeji]|uniref:Pyridoxamine 5'-phosphate oxidase n=1 Tax=Lyophyllum shimeji TaxID=47721 RepID=A0A9P3UUW9_LYOSH|nr:putative pyridoxamine 5'-phosphate oxidase [Lyophyllum shimeji]
MAASSVPGWKTAVTKALEEYPKSVVIQLASIDATSPVPQVRSHIFREFLTPTSAPSLPLLVTTTDIRTPKISQVISNSHVQVAWWIEGTQEQFRISGLASVIPAAENALHKHFLHNVKHAPSGSALAAFSKEDFDWEGKRMALFKSMSAHMKASWCRPVPGTRLEGGPDEAKKWPERLEEPGDHADDETRKNWETALGNFALLVVDPTEVDFVELGVMPNRRTRFWRSSSGSWDSEAVVP